MILTSYFLLSLFCFVKVFFVQESNMWFFIDWIYCVLCSVQYTLSFEDVLFDLFVMNTFMQQHVGMLASWFLFWPVCVSWSACLLFWASRRRMSVWLKSIFVCLSQSSPWLVWTSCYNEAQSSKSVFLHRRRTCGYSQIELIVFRVLCSTLCPLKMYCLSCL